VSNSRSTLVTALKISSQGLCKQAFKISQEVDMIHGEIRGDGEWGEMARLRRGISPDLIHCPKSRARPALPARRGPPWRYRGSVEPRFGDAVAQRITAENQQRSGPGDVALGIPQFAHVSGPWVDPEQVLGVVGQLAGQDALQ
jgi:hypothetical protein